VANENINNGPIIQVIKKEIESSFGRFHISGILLKSTLVSGGYIMRMSPIARGILVVPLLNELITIGI
jgi:hypothetical protein